MLNKTRFYNNFKKFVQKQAELAKEDPLTYDVEIDHSNWETCAFGLFIMEQLHGLNKNTELKVMLSEFAHHLKTTQEKFNVGIMLLKWSAPKDLVKDLTEQDEDIPSIKTWGALSKRISADVNLTESAKCQDPIAVLSGENKNKITKPLLPLF